MRHAKRGIAASLLIVMLLSLAITAADSVILKSETEGAVYFAQQLERGITEIRVQVPKDFDFEIFYSYTRMLYPGYYSMSWTLSRQTAVIRAVFGDYNKHLQAREIARQLVQKLVRDDMTQREKLKVLHDYLAQNCEYDTQAAMNLQIASADAFSAYGALVLQQAVCDGYSAAYAMLCHYAGIPCLYFPGKAMNHAWNVVLYGTQLLHVDVTFDDTSSVVGRVNQTYFMRTTAQMEKTHTWDHKTADTLVNTVWNESYRSAYALSLLGLFRGSDKGFELERQPLRCESAVMLTRLLGVERQAEKTVAGKAFPFTDVTAFYQPYVAYLHQNGLTAGTTATTYGSMQSITAAQYMTFMLRVLGYDDAQGDFYWATSVEFAAKQGILSEEEAQRLQRGGFDRGTMAFVSLKILQADTTSGTPLYQQLAARGILSVEKMKEILK